MFKCTIISLGFILSSNFLFSQSDSVLINTVEWLQQKLNCHEIERYRSGEVYMEYDIKISFDYDNNNLIYEIDWKGALSDNHPKYIIPLRYINKDRITIERNRCCANSKIYYETNEADIHLYTINNLKLIRRVIVNKYGEEYEPDYKWNNVSIFIPTAVINRNKNLPEKCVKVLELLIRLSKMSTD